VKGETRFRLRGGEVGKEGLHCSHLLRKLGIRLGGCDFVCQFRWMIGWEGLTLLIKWSDKVVER